MTRRKIDVQRPYRPERVSRETMAYLLDMSTDTFDRLVSTGRLPGATIRAGIKRWNPAEVIAIFDGLPGSQSNARLDDEGKSESDIDPLLTNIEAFRGGAKRTKADRGRGAA